MSSLLGRPAPVFQARSDDGERISSADLLGRWTVLYFFGRALDPAGRLEVQRFQAAQEMLAAQGARVIGVSADTEAHLALLRERCALTHPLLPDGERTLAGRYGVGNGWLGRLGRGQRQTFLLGPQGQVAWHWTRVNPDHHVAEVQLTLARLAGAPTRLNSHPA
jgi:thioredoxin-dependent peroxiredoxin